MTRLCTFQAQGQPRVGVLVGEVVADLNKAFALSRGGPPKGYWPTMIDFLAGGGTAAEAAREVERFVASQGEALRTPSGEPATFALGEIKLLAPVPRPPKVICLAGNYASHVRERNAAAPLPEEILVFTKPPGTAIIAHEEPVVVPNWISKLDYEAEIGAIIGLRGRHIPVERALEHVGGYTVCNDVSDRAYLGTPRGHDWFAMKGQDNFGPMGPFMILADDAPGAANLAIQLRVNGELRQNATTNDMVFNVAQVISRLSQLVTLEVGDVIETGTPAGPAGMSGGKFPFLKDGDVVEVQIEGIGLLRNRIVFTEPTYCRG